ncbi:uncharacterized protein LOC130798866 [Amaranthus tricolor]|uniref:uncharacterized protein LOC130798866 n=1 Tax=Amaranthus tricolor TaxID=29722 RepID=UPI0025879402|nr:uncharacterized protein LOC130798866 [Amaranthus tricolor]
MGRYRRTVSFPNQPTPNTRPSGPSPKSYHVRSASLPCGRPHPLIPQLREEVTELWVWERAQTGPGSRFVVDGLSRLKGVLDSLDDVLQLPLTQDSLSSKTNLVEKLLEEFLRFVDAYGIFQASLLGLKEEVSAAQVAVRRKDDSNLSLFIKSQKKIAGDVGKLISSVTSSTLEPPSASTTTIVSDYDDELGHVIRDVHKAIASVSEAVFDSVSGSFGPCRKPIWASFGIGRKIIKKEEQGMIEEFQSMIKEVENLLELIKNCKDEKKKRNNKNNDEELTRMRVLKGMQELEDCIGNMEKGSERVFRSLISTRVSLLNILTHA